MRHHDQPGCVVAIAHKERIVLEEAFGRADIAKGSTLTPRHRFRAASHTKSFTAAAIMKLREQGRLKLDDRAGRYVGGLHPAAARVALAQLLAHSAGLVRDGRDSGQFTDERPFLDANQLLADLKLAPAIAPNTRFKYSNHGYALLGLVIEALTGEPWREWAGREIIGAAGLDETLADGPPPSGMPLALGHSGKLPLGRRVGIPGSYSANAIAPAAGVISTARDLVRFFGQLSPAAGRSVLSTASRREMIRRRWRDPHSRIERYYGLGIVSGGLGGWRWFGHSGGLQGYITRTCVLPGQELALSVLTNAVDGPAHFWMDGLIHILRTCAEHGAPARQLGDWRGRWWSLWGAVDLVPMGNKVLAAAPVFFDPFADASEIHVTRRDRGRIVLAAGYASHGEPARLVRDRRGRIVELWLGGSRYRAEAAVAKIMNARYRKR